MENLIPYKFVYIDLCSKVENKPDNGIVSLRRFFFLGLIGKISILGEKL